LEHEIEGAIEPGITSPDTPQYCLTFTIAVDNHGRIKPGWKFTEEPGEERDGMINRRHFGLWQDRLERWNIWFIRFQL